MSCNRNHGRVLSNNRANGYRAINCGYEASWSNVRPKCVCPTVLTEKVVEEFPLTCKTPQFIHVDRVTTIAGVDSAVFLTGDCPGYRMNEYYNIVVSDDVIALQSFHMPAYLLLKSGNLNTESVSVGDIENHPISAFLRGNNHLFGGKISELYELAPEDFNVEANKGDPMCGPPPRVPVVRVVDPASLNHQYITIEVSWYECGQYCYREIFYLIPLECANGMKLKGANLANWIDDRRTCGEVIYIPCKSLDTGALKIADKPEKCGCDNRGYAYGNGYVGYGRNFAFNGFGY